MLGNLLICYVCSKKKPYIYPMKRTRILAVNDHIRTLKLIELEFGRRGLPIEVDKATDGYGAVQKIEKGEQYDAILMNLEMPFMNGWQATQKIREMGVNTPIIAWSAHLKDFVIESCRMVGMNNYIQLFSVDLIKDILEALNKVGVKV